MLFDTHCHLTSPEFSADLDGVIGRAKEAGVEGILSVAVDLADALATREIALKHPGFLRWAAGIHPESAGRVAAGWEAELERIIVELKPNAIGECGLDGHHPEPPMAVQLPVFRAQLRLARTHRLPIVIHSRKAGEECLREIDLAGGLPAGGVFHCIEGDEILARAIVNAGFHVGLGGIATYPRNDVLRAMLVRLPQDRLLLETDAPWLPPVPHRGKRNEPSFVALTAEAVAKALGMPADELGALTAANARKLFGG